MASGYSKRFGKNKLLEVFNGKKIIEYVLDLNLENKVVITRYPEIFGLCKSKSIPCVIHDFPNRNDTIRLGIQALGNVDGYLFLQADQPFLKDETITLIKNTFYLNDQKIIRLNNGSPVLFPAKYKEELLHLPEKKGGSYVIEMHKDSIVNVVTDIEETIDIDVPEDLTKLKK